MGLIRIPPTADAETAKAFRDLETAILKIIGANNADFKGRRITNAGSAQADGDYVTLLDVKGLIAKGVQRSASSIAGSASGTPGTGGSGGGGPLPTVPLPDESGTVEAYAAAHPDQLADSCQDSGGSWDFMDGVVAALQAIDTRWGYNGKRGDVNDPSQDAVAYYHGELSVMVAGSPAAYVVDIIGGHCGPDPQPAWIDQTVIGSTGAAWLPNRP
jgi:hypothetical protein